MDYTDFATSLACWAAREAASVRIRPAYPGQVLDILTRDDQEFHVVVREGRSVDLGPDVRV